MIIFFAEQVFYLLLCELLLCLGRFSVIHDIFKKRFQRRYLSNLGPEAFLETFLSYNYKWTVKVYNFATCPFTPPHRSDYVHPRDMPPRPQPNASLYPIS